MNEMERWSKKKKKGEMSTDDEPDVTSSLLRADL